MNDTKVPLTDEMFVNSLKKAVQWVEGIVRDKSDPIKAFIPTMFLECSGFGALPQGDEQSNEDTERQTPKGSDPATSFPFGTAIGAEPKGAGVSDRYTVMAMMPDMDMDQRHKALEAFGYKVGSEGVLVWAVYFVAEAWTSHNVHRPEMGEVGKKGKYEMPADDPERGEVIVVMGMTIDSRCNVAQVNVTRNKKGEMVLGETKFITPTAKPPGGGGGGNNGVAEKDRIKLRNVLCEYFFRGYAVGFLSKNAALN